jgi:hypothetical protein
MSSGVKDDKQRRRIALKLSTLSRKAYICSRAPNPRLSSIACKKGLFTTDYPEEWARIGVDIFG